MPSRRRRAAWAKGVTQLETLTAKAPMAQMSSSRTRSPCGSSLSLRKRPGSTLLVLQREVPANNVAAWLCPGSWPLLFLVGEGRMFCLFETPSGPQDPLPIQVGQVTFTLPLRPVSLQSPAFPCSKKSLTLTPSHNTARSVTCAERACRRQRHLTVQRNRALARCRQESRALNQLSCSISSFVGVALSPPGPAPALPSSMLPVLPGRMRWVFSKASLWSLVL